MVYHDFPKYATLPFLHRPFKVNTEQFSVFKLRHKHIIFTWRPYWCTACSLAYVKIQSDVGFCNTCQRKINEFDRSVGENQVKLMEMIAMSFLYC